jgi:hypothetical protein
MRTSMTVPIWNVKNVYEALREAFDPLRSGMSAGHELSEGG